MASEIKTFRSLLLVLSALVFDTTSPRAKGDCLKSGWLGRIMGVSPLRGSLAAALLACFPYWELGLDGSIPRQGSWRNQPATGWFRDGWDRWAPYLAVIYTKGLRAGGLGASSLGAGTAGNVFRIGYSDFKELYREVKEKVPSLSSRKNGKV